MNAPQAAGNDHRTSPGQPPPRQHGKPIRRGTKIMLWIVALLIAIPAIALVILLNYDWNKARPWLNAKTSEAIGRPFAIVGNLALTWEKPANAMADHDKTWRDFIPWPHLVANDVHVGNPEGIVDGSAKKKDDIKKDDIKPADIKNNNDMASVKQFSFSLNPLALLHKSIAIPVLRFEGPSVELLRNKDGVNNWTFKQDKKKSPWQLDLERIVLTKGVVHIKDAVTDADITADIDTVNDPIYGVAWKLKGTYNDAPVTGGGKAGAVLSLKQQSTPYPIMADMHMGRTHARVEGTVTKPTQLAALDLHLKVSGASMAQLFPLTGVLLPETPAFTTEGRLLGAIDDKSSRWTYDGFTGKVGSSDIGGKLVFQSAKPRSKLTGDVNSRLLQFADLGPLVGADSNASKQARGVAAVQPNGKVLPVETFRTERWTAIDADVRYSADKIVRTAQLPIKKLTTHLILDNGVITLAPLNFDMAGGNINSTIKMDGSGREGKNAIRATAKVAARHIHIRELFPTIEKMQGTVGEINGDASLSATGNSVASLLGNSNGEVRTLINQGSISKLLLEEMGLNVGNIVLSKLFGDKQVQLNCMATDFGVTNGLMQTRTFIVDTDEAILKVNGTINLANEQLGMTLLPQTKGLRIFSLRAPLYVRGAFSKPDVSVDKGVLAMRAGGAIALGLAAPIAALLPLVHAGPGEDSNCARLLAMAREKPVAPPPGKTGKH